MHYWAERMMRAVSEASTTLYSFWMSYDAYAAALCKRRHPGMRCVVRGHAYDIDVERVPLNPYFMKKRIAKEADGLYFISETAKQQYLSYMQGKVKEEKLHVLAMGSGGEPVETFREAPLYTQGVFRVVSCAQVLPIKQVEMMVEALSQWKGVPLCWTHIGGGEGLEELRQMADHKLGPKENVICELLGQMKAARIQKIYEERAFDVIVNTSRKEGVPISIMEAMRHGTPVIAPAVGGIPELVTPEVGWLYQPEEGAQGVLNALEKLAAFSQEEAEAMRAQVRAYWNEHCCSSALLPQLFPETARSVRR
jgi:glycosyltransferase involved in cell wall biosynthesis